MARRKKPPTPANPTGPLYLTEWMEHLKIDDEELAKRMGTDTSTIWRWCQAKRAPNPITQARIAAALHIWPGQLWADPTSKAAKMIGHLIEDDPPKIKPYTPEK